MPTLAFYIDAPMQSWGASSRFQYRETNGFPTKSALVGLIAGALGIDKHRLTEAEQLQPVADLKLTVVRLHRSKIAPTRFTDFHTVGGGYPDTYQGKLNIPPIAERSTSGALKWKTPEKRTVPTYRSYLTDASFAALLEGESALLERIQAALLDPVWGVWFGRKTCLPASPLTPTLGEDRQNALDQLLDSLPHMEAAPLEQFEYQEEVAMSDDADGIFYQSDQPVAFGQHHGAVPAAYKARGIAHRRPQN